MRIRSGKGMAFATAATLAVQPVSANRLTFEVWPDANPSAALFCSIALLDGWMTLVQVQGAGLPAQPPVRWRASDVEDQAMTAALQAFLEGELASVDPYVSRLPPAPFVTVTWMTTLDDHMAMGLYIQSGLALPDTIARLSQVTGLGQPCGLTARTVE
jgi:hypothetical protein